MEKITILLIGILLGSSGTVVAYVIHRAFRIIEAEQERKKQSQNTDAGLLDTMADLNLVEFNLVEIRGRLETIYRQVELAKGRTGIIRQGPYAYPKDKTSEEIFNDRD